MRTLRENRTTAALGAILATALVACGHGAVPHGRPVSAAKSFPHFGTQRVLPFSENDLSYGPDFTVDTFGAVYKPHGDRILVLPFGASAPVTINQGYADATDAITINARGEPLVAHGDTTATRLSERHGGAWADLPIGDVADIRDVVASGDGKIYVDDGLTRTLHVYPNDTSAISERRISLGSVGRPGEIAVGPDGAIYVTDEGANPALWVIPPGDDTTRKVSLDDTTVKPEDIAVGADGVVYIADGSRQQVVMWYPGASHLERLPFTSSNGLGHIGIDRAGNIYLQTRTSPVRMLMLPHNPG